MSVRILDIREATKPIALSGDIRNWSFRVLGAGPGLRWQAAAIR